MLPVVIRAPKPVRARPKRLHAVVRNWLDGHDIERALASLPSRKLAWLGLDIRPMDVIPVLAFSVPVHEESGYAAKDVAFVSGIENDPAAIAGYGTEETTLF